MIHAIHLCPYPVAQSQLFIHDVTFKDDVVEGLINNLRGRMDQRGPTLLASIYPASPGANRIQMVRSNSFDWLLSICESTISGFSSYTLLKE